MQHLYFIRCRTSSSYPYDEWTDVWVFGDVGGYATAERCFLDAVESRTPIPMPSGRFTKNSLPVLILPVSSGDDTGIRVRIGEFVVSQTEKLRLQLVVRANKPGYEYLAAQFRHARTQLDRNPLDHLHVDGRELVQRSVTLNIRGPVHPWSAKGIHEYQSLFDRHIELPDGAAHMVTPPEDFYEFTID